MILAILRTDCIGQMVPFHNVSNTRGTAKPDTKTIDNNYYLICPHFDVESLVYPLALLARRQTWLSQRQPALPAENNNFLSGRTINQDS